MACIANGATHRERGSKSVMTLLGDCMVIGGGQQSFAGCKLAQGMERHDR